MGSTKGIMWNCGGLRRDTASTYSKVMYFEKTFKNKFDFFFFLETHHKNKSELPDEILRYEDTHHIIHSETKEGDIHTHPMERGIVQVMDTQSYYGASSYISGASSYISGVSSFIYATI